MTSPTNSTPDATTEVEPASMPTTMFAVARTQLAAMLAIATLLPNSMSSSSDEAALAIQLTPGQGDSRRDRLVQARRPASCVTISG